MEDKNHQIIQNYEELRSQWDKISDLYEQQMEKQTALLGQTVLQLIDIQNAKCILEVGCGSGYLAVELLRQKNKESKLICSDISPEMLNKTKQRLNYVLENGFINYKELNFQRENDTQQIQMEKLNKQNCETYVLNSEDLSIIGDNSVDRYICILSLHITTNPTKQLLETYRVMEIGGICCFVVWGRKENSLLFTLADDTTKIYTSQQQQQLHIRRSNFHLSDRDSLIKLFQEHGFCDIVSWYQYLPVTIHQQSFQHLLNFPNIKNPVNSVQDPDLQNIIKQHIIQQMETNLLVNQLPLGFEALFLIAKKL